MNPHKLPCRGHNADRQCYVTAFELTDSVALSICPKRCCTRAYEENTSMPENVLSNHSQEEEKIDCATASFGECLDVGEDFDGLEFGELGVIP